MVIIQLRNNGIQPYLQTNKYEIYSISSNNLEYAL